MKYGWARGMDAWVVCIDGRKDGWMKQGWLGGGLPETVTHYRNLYRVSAYTGVLSAYHEGLTQRAVHSCQRYRPASQLQGRTVPVRTLRASHTLCSKIPTQRMIDRLAEIYDVMNESQWLYMVLS